MSPIRHFSTQGFFRLGLYGVFALLLSAAAYAGPVDWRGPGGSRIRAVYQVEQEPQEPELQPFSASTNSVSANTIDSPPMDSFVPWIALVATNRRLSEDDWTAVVEPFVRGNYPAGIDPKHDFMIGLYDTGASTHVIGHQNAVTAGLFNSTYLTTNTSVVSGVTGSVEAYVSMPLALYMAGLDALDPNSPGDPEAVLTTTAGMKGQSNVSVLVGDYPGSYPDLYTAIGSPMSAYYTAHIENSTPVTVLRNGETYTAPRITFYDKDDSSTPSYPNKVPLELRPLGAVNVQYTPTIDLMNFDYNPSTPSVIMGNSSQSLFFVHSVDLREGEKTAIDKDRFMLDTGAQVTTIGSRVAARLGLDPAHKEFEVEIIGVTGEPLMAPGFYIDAITIPAIGQWLEYTNVPVILLDISSPEGGKLDGIIGMNLFVEHNLVLRGGGFFLDDDPVLEFERISSSDPLTGDIAPSGGDGWVDYQDFSVFSTAWLTTTGDAHWNPGADFIPNGAIGLPDLQTLADNWLAGATP